MHQVDFDLFPGMKFAAQSQISSIGRSARRMFGSPTESAEMPPLGDSNNGSRRPPAYAPVAASDIERSPNGCAITQTIHNRESRPLSPIALDFSFEDALGAPIGEEMRAKILAVLPAGMQHTFTFRVPCPGSFASVKVRAPGKNPASSTPADAAAIVESDHETWMQGANGEQLAFQIPGKVFECPQLDKWELTVRFDHGSMGTYAFQCLSGSPGILVTDDLRLIEWLQQGRQATVEVPTPDGLRNLIVTENHLQRSSGS